MRFEATPQVSKLASFPAPVKGINAFDSIASVPEGFALVLRNFFAQPYGCKVRSGYARHSTVDVTGTVESLCSHNNGDDAKLYAFESNGVDHTMYDVTTRDAPANNRAVMKIVDLSNSRWQHINFANVAGTHMLAVNGADDPIWWHPDGTITRVVAGDGITVGTISGIDPRTLIHIYSHQKRIWFVEDDSTAGWYLPPDQLYGVADLFDFGAQWVRGGKLNQIITWTIDDGNGADDHLVAISTEGEASVYQGTDPNNIDTWSLQGVYYMGPPVGRRASTRYGGDIVTITQHGVVYLSELLKSTKVNPTEEGSGRYVQQLISNAATIHGDRFGWQPVVYPRDNLFLVNIPVDVDESFQFAMNDITKAWSEFLGVSGLCWELHEDRLYFGGFGGVFLAWQGHTDDAEYNAEGALKGGVDIRSEAQTTYSALNASVVNKHLKMVRPSILSGGRFSASLTVNVDYSFQSPLSPVAYDSYEPGVWDEGFWDEARWAGGLTAYHEWISVKGIGFVASMRILLTSSAETYWASTDWLYEPGGIM